MGYQRTIGIILTARFAPGDALFNLGLYSLANAVAWNTDPGATVIEDDWSSPHDPRFRKAWVLERKEQASLVHEVFGNVFRPVALDTAWLTPSVVALAQAMYEDRAFDRMPALADALEEAGCTDAEILRHCREPGPHVRGCCPLDLVLGKA
jgi:hypothetical protein